MKIQYSLGAPRHQHGIMLLEALIAVVIFSVGILAVVALQAVAIRETTQAKMRSDASYLADKVIGDLSSLDVLTGATTGSTILTDFGGTYTATAGPGAAGAIAATWQQYIAQALPDGRLTLTFDMINDPVPDPTPGAAVRRIPQVVVDVQWRLPSNDAAGNPLVANFRQTSRLVN